jgi:ADP-ribosylglycohydrolase
MSADGPVLVPRELLKDALLQVLAQRIDQGCELDEAVTGRRIIAAAGSYDALYEIARELRDPPMRADWPYREPIAWDEIVAESEQLDPGRDWPAPDLSLARGKVREGFLGSVCGCMLGKPVEIDPSLAELKRAGESVGEWPLRDYISGQFLETLGRRHDSWSQTIRENLHCAVADDDIHYTLCGMLLLEAAGPAFTHDDLFRSWSLNLAPGWTWGAERTALLGHGLARHHLFGENLSGERDVLLLNPGDEMCGALIRADVYGFACPGNPDLAAWLAWKDASFTHIKTGVYGAMFIAALVALCHEADAGLEGGNRLELVLDALRRVPKNTRFASVVRDCVERVGSSGNWEEGYQAINGRYGRYSHCQIYQEIGTLVNTLRYAESTDHGFCLQVSQGNDTDSFGALAGSILGVLFGPGHLAPEWLDPLENRVMHAMADFHEQGLDKLSERLAGLPETVFASWEVQRPALARE